jgi:hypothetical protein
MVDLIYNASRLLACSVRFKGNFSIAAGSSCDPISSLYVTDGFYAKMLRRENCPNGVPWLQAVFRVLLRDENWG